MTNSSLLISERLTEAAIQAVLETRVGDEVYGLDDDQRADFGESIRSAVEQELINERSKWSNLLIKPEDQKLPDDAVDVTYRVTRSEEVKALVIDRDGNERLYDVGKRVSARDIKSPLRVTVIPGTAPSHSLRGFTPIDDLLI